MEKIKQMAQEKMMDTTGMTAEQIANIKAEAKMKKKPIVKLHPSKNKFHTGNQTDTKHYWLTPPEIMEKLNKKHKFDFDPCPFPLPDGFDGLSIDWGKSNYVNPPFGSIMHNGRKKGFTAWVRKAIAENKKGKRVVMVYPMQKWLFMLLEAGVEISNLGNIRWLATEDKSQGRGTGWHIACFVLNPPKKGSKCAS